jgi:tetratricopeptide (TPR) repeat protein
VKGALSLVLFVLVTHGPAGSQTAAAGLYAEGNAFYRQNEFATARERYMAAVESGVRDARLFYNLGNACFKSDRLGEAVLWYERAQRLEPRDPDILANLRFVRRVKRDQDPDGEGGGLYGVYLWPTMNELFAATSLGLLGLFLLACWRLWQPPGATAQVTLVILGVWILTAGVFTGARLQRELSLVEAIVLVEEGTARSGPEPAQTPVFVVHEGTKVVVERREDGWLLVRLANGLGGWLPDEVLAVI